MVLLKITELFDVILEDGNVSRMKGYSFLTFYQGKNANLWFK